MRLITSAGALGVGLALTSVAQAGHGDASLAHSEDGGPNPSSSSVTDDFMGPAAFMWPPDRVWSGDMDNQAPCGSRAAPGNRTKFPMTGGVVSLVAQDDYYNSKISISYSNDPQTNTDFTTLMETNGMNDLNPGHTCVKLPDAPAQVSAGTNATIQIIYKANWDAPHNQTFYACADIAYVPAADFKRRIPCFNATEPGEDDKRPPSGNSGNKESGGSGNGSGAGNNGSNRLKPGALAGVIAGSIIGTCVLSGACLFLFRRREQKKRMLRLAQMEENAKRSEYHDDLGSAKTGM